MANLAKKPDAGAQPLAANLTALSALSAAAYARAVGIVPAARVHNDAAISLATSGTVQTLTFNTERFDTDSLHDGAAPSRLTCTTAGLYVVSATVNFAAHGTGKRELYLRLNGDTFIAAATQPTNSSGSTLVTVTTLYKLAATNYVEVQAAQSSGGALNVTSNGNYSPEFSIAWIGEG